MGPSFIFQDNRYAVELIGGESHPGHAVTILGLDEVRNSMGDRTPSRWRPCSSIIEAG
jgi:hypothetical protein